MLELHHAEDAHDWQAEDHPDHDVHDGDDKADLPPLALAHEARAEENWRNAAAVVRQERCTVAEDCQDDCRRDDRGTCRNENRREGDEHRSDVGAVTGEQIVGQRVDDAEDDEHRHPGHASAGGSHRGCEPLHETELREIRSHVDENAHPYEDIPCTMLFRDVAPVNALRDEHGGEAEQCDNSRIDMMDAARCPEHEAGDEDDAEDLLLAGHGAHRAEFFLGKRQSLRRFREFRLDDLVEQVRRDD